MEETFYILLAILGVFVIIYALAKLHESEVSKTIRMTVGSNYIDIYSKGDVLRTIQDDYTVEYKVIGLDYSTDELILMETGKRKRNGRKN